MCGRAALGYAAPGGGVWRVGTGKPRREALCGLFSGGASFAFSGALALCVNVVGSPPIAFWGVVSPRE